MLEPESGIYAPALEGNNSVLSTGLPFLAVGGQPWPSTRASIGGDHNGFARHTWWAVGYDSLRHRPSPRFQPEYCAWARDRPASHEAVPTSGLSLYTGNFATDPASRAASALQNIRRLCVNNVHYLQPPNAFLPREGSGKVFRAHTWLLQASSAGYSNDSERRRRNRTASVFSPVA